MVRQIVPSYSRRQHLNKHHSNIQVLLYLHHVIWTWFPIHNLMNSQTIQTTGDMIPKNKVKPAQIHLNVDFLMKITTVPQA